MGSKKRFKPRENRCLVLNKAYQPIEVIDYKNAFRLLFTGKATSVKSYDKKIRTVSTFYKYPAVIRVPVYVKPAWFIDKATKHAVYARDKGRCQYCLKRLSTSEMTLDHVVPKSRGGTNRWTNLVSACYKCNNEKNDRTPDEWGVKLNSTPRTPNKFELNMPDEWKDFLPI